MRRFVFFTLALALSGCCCNNCSRPTENFVSDVPTTLSDAKKRAQPPSVTVEVQRITKRGGGGGACHSAVCLLLLPVLVYEAALPEQWVLLPTDDNTTHRDDHTDLILLTRLLGADRVEFRPRLVSDDGRGRRRWRGFDIYVHWDGGAIHHHSQLSFGQKRLIALVWDIGLNPELPLLTDEMTNGLHAGWVRAIIDHIGPRQGFHSVQNPLLLDRYGPGKQAEENIAGRFVICTVEPGERGRQWRWRSPTTVECERLWAAYNAGFQHLSELLISEGLW